MAFVVFFFNCEKTLWIPIKVELRKQSATRYGYKDFSLKGSLSECPAQFVPSLSECRLWHQTTMCPYVKLNLTRAHPWYPHRVHTVRPQLNIAPHCRCTMGHVCGLWNIWVKSSHPIVWVACGSPVFYCYLTIAGETLGVLTVSHAKTCLTNHLCKIQRKVPPLSPLYNIKVQS